MRKLLTSFLSFVSVTFGFGFNHTLYYCEHGKISFVTERPTRNAPLYLYDSYLHKVGDCQIQCVFDF